MTPNEDLLHYLKENSPGVRIYSHEECRTSEESARARANAGAGYVTGAKAILMKLDIRDDVDAFGVFVLPGHGKIDSKKLKTGLRQRVPSFRSFRFATAEEMSAVARGVQPGCMPPFAAPIFPAISYIFVDDQLSEHDQIGFNLARFDQSAVMPTSEYMRLIPVECCLPFSLEDN